MRWAIRQQILVPIVAIQTLALAAITVVSVRLAERRAEGEIEARLAGVVEVLGSSNFPLGGAILARMQGLSGARFISYDAGGRPLAASEPGLLDEAPAAEAIPVRGREAVPRLGQSPAIRVKGQDHLAALLTPRATGPGGPEALLVLYPESSWREARRAAAQAPMLLGAGAVLLMAAATSWIAHRISARVRRLEQQVARIAEGDFREVAISRGGHADEVQDLAASINRMCGELGRMSRTIRESERAQLLAQLAAGLAHQLRNALTGARLSLQLHQRRCEKARDEPSIGVALRQLTLVEEQVRGLLTIGQVERRPRRDADLARLLNEVAILLGPTCEHARVRLLAGQSFGEAIAHVDEPGVRAAVLNLALNGIEAAGPGGTIALELVEEPQAWLLRVSDTGAGPPASTAAALFEPFVTSKPEGIGLGLALARRVSEAHHGGLSWSRDGGWTRFCLRLSRNAGAEGAG